MNAKNIKNYLIRFGFLKEKDAMGSTCDSTLYINKKTALKIISHSQRLSFNSIPSLANQIDLQFLQV